MQRIGLTLAFILALEPNTAAAQQATTVYAREPWPQHHLLL